MKLYEESEIEFRIKNMEDAKGTPFLPQARTVIVRCYGGTAEECIATARKQFTLGDGWEVVGFEGAQV